ncbi:MAG: 2-dehydropantoate 2-reductase [Anaerolineae bacterium]|nr:2-dehydropantoate 2-reductase [Anaerolineae bacterium]
MTNSLQMLVFGAGAIGTYIGGSLALRGHRAVFIERPEVATRVRAQGLRIEPPDSPPRHTEVDCVTSVKEALAYGAFDVAIFALKSYDTQSAIEGLAPHLKSLPPFLCLQNGVENEAILARSLGADRVIAGTVTSAIGRRAAGDVVVERLRGVGIADGHPMSRRLVDEMQAAGLNARLYSQAAGMKWSKLLTNLLANATSAILDMTPADIFAHPGLYRLEIEQLRETLAVMASLGIRPVNLPKTPVQTLAFAVRHLPLFLSRPLLARAVGSGRGGKMPSFHIDLHSGSGRSEVDTLNGAVARFGEKTGIPTPVNRLLTDTLLALVSGSVQIEEFAHQPEKLLKAWQ